MRPGPTTHGLWVRGLWAWKPVTNPTARALASWLCPLLEAARGAWGGALLAWVWGVRGPAPSLARPLVLGACGRGGLPTGCGYGGCGRGDPSSTPQRALLRAGFARREGGTKAARGGRRLLPGCRASAVGRYPLPDRPSLGRAPGARYPMAPGAGAVGVGTRHQPHSLPLASWLCALWGRHGGAPGGRLLPACGAFGVGRTTTPNRWSLGRAAWACYPLAVGAGDLSVRTRHQSHSARSCELALRAVGRHEGAGGGRPLLTCGASGNGRSPTPDRPCLGRAAGAPCPLAVGAGGVGFGTRHPPHSARSCELPLRAVGWHKGAAGGRLLPACRASGVGRSPAPDRPSLGRAAGAGYLLADGAGSVGVGTRHEPHSARSSELGGRHKGARAKRLLPACGASGLGRSPTPDCPSLGRAGGARYPLSVGEDGTGVATRHQPHSAHFRELALRAVGRHEGARGGHLLPACGVS